MNKETRKKLNVMIDGLNDSFPSKAHGFKKILKVVLVKDDLEIHEVNFTAKGKVKSTKKLQTVAQPEKKANYTWEDMLSMGLSCATIPIFIFTAFQKEQEDSFKKRVMKKQKVKPVDAEIIEEVIEKEKIN